MDGQAGVTTMQTPAPEATPGGNATLWNSVEMTNPQYTTNFTTNDGFNGTAISGTFQAKRATEAFGPMGLGWGVDILEEKYVEGASLGFDSQGNTLGNEKIHILKMELWYIYQGRKGSIKHFGATTFVGKSRLGVFTDEDAPKKSMTDGMSKCLSLLGFGADVHMGLFDDHKYVQSAKEHFESAAIANTSSAGTTDGGGSAVSGNEAAHLSERYAHYKQMLKTGVKNVAQARLFIQSDHELTEMERAMLLSAQELKEASETTEKVSAAEKSGGALFI